MKTIAHIRAYASLICIVLLFSSCGEDDSSGNPTLKVPELTTATVSDIGPSSAKSGGNISSDGGAAVTAHGVCWSSASNPTTTDSKTSDGPNTGTYKSSITGLTANTLYHVRAYAINSVGTAYGNDIAFTTTNSITLPSLTTTEISAITKSSASTGGEITNSGGSNITARGVCWSMSQNPTISDAKTNDGNGTGTFISSIAGLSSNTTYHVRAYATNSTGTAYGTDRTFTTKKETTGEVVTDIEGNSYETVTIGTQVWMSENLKTTKYNDGGAIPIIMDNTAWANDINGAYSWYNNDEGNFKATYGALYNKYAVNTNKLCPTGWHIPQPADWTILVNFVGGSTVAGGELKEAGFTHWKDPNWNATNSSGFTALPGGYRAIDGKFKDAYFSGYWWWLNLNYYVGYSISGTYDPAMGLSVRCIKD